MNEFKVRVERLVYADSIGMWIINYSNKKTYVAKKMELEFVELPQGHQLPEPSMSIDGMYAINLIKALLEGLEESHFVRTKIKEDSRHLDAMKENLLDLRKISDRLLGVIEKANP